MRLKILHTLTEILVTLNEIKIFLREQQSKTLTEQGDELLDNSDAKRFLKIGDSTLYRWRKQKLISAQLIGRKHYYLKSALKKLVENLGCENSSIK